MAANSFRSCTFVCLLGIVTSLALTTACDGQILYDNLQDELDSASYELTGGGDLSWVDDGLNFASSQIAGVAIFSEGVQLPATNAWSFRARFTINGVFDNTIGLAGVVVEHPTDFMPRRWVAVLPPFQELSLGQDFDPEEVEIPGDLLGDPLVVQLDYSGDSLTGHSWRPDSPTDVTTIQYSKAVSDSPGVPRLANNGADATYHAIWISPSPLPMPTGFEDQGDLNGNEILEIGDIDVLAEQIRDGVVSQDELRLWITDYFGTWVGDANLDRQVNSADLNALALNWRSGVNAAPATAAVPEPAGVLLLSVGLIGLVVQRHRRR